MSEGLRDLSPERIEWMAEQYRLAVAARLLACFKKSEGRAAANVDELTNWVADNDDKIPHDADGNVVPLYEDES